MVSTPDISVQRASRSRLSQVDFSNIPFGKVYTDHMLVADFRGGAWQSPRIVPYGTIALSPASPALHYGQAIFEGLKAFRGPNGEALVFRPQANWQRLNRSAERMCLQPVPESIFMDGLRVLLDLDRAWVPATPGSSLYIRPFLFSADENIGIKPSEHFTFMIILCPVGPYYTTPVKVRIETQFTRAVKGGTGYAKAGGNYGGAMYPAKRAQDRGYHQLIWTDGIEHKYVEESGTMNIMFVKNGALLTPALTDSILPGITRDSVLHLARHWNMPVEERRISVDELVEGLRDKTVTEAFGVGTAATIAPIELIGHEDTDYILPPAAQRPFANRVLKVLDEMKRGLAPDLFGWIVKM
jgi:branched-chain amino acid aminotransferase